MGRLAQTLGRTKTMNSTVAKHLNALAEEGERLEQWPDFRRWSAKARTFIAETLGPDERDRFDALSAEREDDTGEQHGLRLGHVQGLAVKIERAEELRGSESAVNTLTGRSIISTGRKVFVVHGHDNEAKESTARFLEKLKLEPIVLHEQANSGRTVIEKFEVYSEDVAFAVVLLTPDDLGKSAKAGASARPRARQNVILELGYFLGRLGRTKVCALYKGGVELPSDYQGVLYIEIDEAGAWKTKLAQELIQAKITIELAGILST